MPRPLVSLQALTAAALVLPGLMSSQVHAADEDEVDFQYSHYQEGKRNLFGNVSAFAPIEVDSLHGGAKVRLADRIKFAFNYLQDTWGGATPISTAPEAFGGNGGYQGTEYLDDQQKIQSGATPYIRQTQVYLDKNLQPVSTKVVNQLGKIIPNNRLVHTLALASPETRKQGDFKLSYDWDEAAVDVGGGISVENDYESRFGNLGGRMDFNNKMTSVNLGLSYTNSDTHAVVDHDASGHFYDTGLFFPYYYNSSHPSGHIQGEPNGFGGFWDPFLITGKREDWGVALGLSQVLNKNAVLSAGLDYTRSTGYLDNPYKAVQVTFIEPGSNCFAPISGLKCGSSRALLESRPDERNQWSGNLGLAQYVQPLDAALHLNYRVFSDDWGITSHTFEADWAQPLGAGWTITPRIRYYSQDQANFYTPGLTSDQSFAPLLVDPERGQVFYTGSEDNLKSQYYYDDLTGALPAPLDPDGNEIRNPNTGNVVLDANGNVVSDPNIVNSLNFGRVPFDKSKLPSHFSSDQRLSGYGALSGGVTLSKQFVKGIALDLGFEYYTHKGSLKIGGGGEGNYADFDYWVANAALKVNLGAMSFNGGGSGQADHSHHGHGGHAPAGVMFDHILPKTGDMMVGYRYQYGSQGGTLLNGTRPVGDAEIIAQGCAPEGLCYLSPDQMSMHMHMVELMYAPTDWLTLMLMPQFMDMDMAMRKPENMTYEFPPGSPGSLGAHVDHHAHNSHETGGIGDLGMYAMFKVVDDGIHHLHATAGVSAPTGDVDIQLRRNHQIDGGFIHYGMQLGSGTWDFKPSLTYTGHINDWSWGAQASGTLRMESHNKSGYRLGDLFQATAWGGYNLTHWLTASVRGVYTTQGRVAGQFYGSENGQFIDPLRLDEFGSPLQSSILKFGPQDYPGNYGGRFWDVGFGLAATVPSGPLAGNKVSVEWLHPVYTDVNGYQLDRDGALSFTWSYGF
jgi:hypothetical protein